MMAKILVVDDSSMSRRTLRKILEPAGHQVTEAADGIAALEQYFLDRPDLVMLDLTMTGMYGIDVLKKLREMDPQTRVIVGSADIQSSTRSLVEEAGAVAFINKPFTVDQVLNAVNRALEGDENGIN
jgi:two-component system chemotaxis response regulator CheY